MIKLSYNEAMRIQEKQLVFYRQAIGYRGLKELRAKTKPCPADLNPDTPISVSKINDMIPRGCAFEWIRDKRKRHPMTYDPIRYSFYEAMEKGKLYH